MATKFHNSVVLQQNSEGVCTYLDLSQATSSVIRYFSFSSADSHQHCSISSPSLCTAKNIRAYFQTGELPVVGTVCEPEQRPFENMTADATNVELSMADAKLLHALKDMSHNVRII